MRPLSFTKREIQGQNSLRIVIDWQKRGREAAILGAVGLFLAFLNPFNSVTHLPFWQGAIYWVSLIYIGALSSEFGQWLLKKVRPDPGPLSMMAISAVFSASLVTVCLLFLEYITRGPVPLVYWPNVFGLVFVISVAMSGLGFLLSMAFDDTAPKDTQNTNPTETFMARLPVKYRTATLYAISSEDHYLRVHTSIGEELILMRLADAERELSGADGLRVHRSWWIAKHGITDERKDSGRSFLVLPSGTEVPVSRSYRPKAKEAGYIS